MKAIGKQPHSKSEILETAFQYYMQFEGFKGQRFDEAEAVAFLSRENLGVKIDNKRHKRAVDMYTIDNPNKPLGIVYPDRFADRRDISTEEEILRQTALAMASKCDELYKQSKSDKYDELYNKASLEDKSEMISPEKKRLIEQENYAEYVNECRERGREPLSIKDYIG